MDDIETFYIDILKNEEKNRELVIQKEKNIEKEG